MQPEPALVGRAARDGAPTVASALEEAWAVDGGFTGTGVWIFRSAFAGIHQAASIGHAVACCCGSTIRIGIARLSECEHASGWRQRLNVVCRSTRRGQSEERAANDNRRTEHGIKPLGYGAAFRPGARYYLPNSRIIRRLTDLTN